MNESICGEPGPVVVSVTFAVVSVLPVTSPRPGKCFTAVSDARGRHAGGERVRVRRDRVERVAELAVEWPIGAFVAAPASVGMSTTGREVRG